MFLLKRNRDALSIPTDRTLATLTADQVTGLRGVATIWFRVAIAKTVPDNRMSEGLLSGPADHSKPHRPETDLSGYRFVFP